MPDRKTKPYHPRHFPDPDDTDSVGGFVVAANSDEYALKKAEDKKAKKAAKEKEAEK